MKTTTLPITKAVYNPQEQRLTFIKSDGKPSHGFVGDVAGRKFLELSSSPQIQISIEDKHNADMTKKIKQFHAILASKGLMDMKEEVLYSYGVKSTKDLTETQLTELINRLNNTDVRPTIREARSTVLSLLGKLGVVGSKELGWEAVNSTLRDTRIAGKDLYMMSLEELRACAKRLRVLLNKK